MKKTVKGHSAKCACGSLESVLLMIWGQLWFILKGKW